MRAASPLLPLLAVPCVSPGRAWFSLTDSGYVFVGHFLMMYFFNGNNSSFLLEGRDVNLSVGLVCKITILNRGWIASIFLCLILFFPPSPSSSRFVSREENCRGMKSGMGLRCRSPEPGGLFDPLSRQCSQLNFLGFVSVCLLPGRRAASQGEGQSAHLLLLQRA